MTGMSATQIEAIYNALDCCVTHEIFTEQGKNLDDIARKTEEFSYALMAPVMEMSLRGVRIDEVRRTEVLNEYLKNHARVKRNLLRIVEEGIGFKNFNYRSPTQVGKLFYDVMGFKEIKGRSSSGRWSRVANRDALEKLQVNWLASPICRHIILLRELDKKINFLEVKQESGRFMSGYNIAGTNTGRLSSSTNDFETGGNSQNVERKLREILIPDEGMKFCNVDLEQADARNVGAICWETFVETHGEAFAGSYLDACESGDLHTTVCRMAWRDLEWGTDSALFRAVADEIAYREFSYRDMSKKLGHGTNYYATPRTAAAHTKVATKVIEEFQLNYFEAFPVIGDANHTPPKYVPGEGFKYDNWHQYVRTQLEEVGSITTPFFNRRRIFYGRPDDDATLREGIAYAPQSMTADEIDQGIINLWRAKLGTQLLVQVHDSILFQYPEEREAEIIPQALELLTIRMQLKKGREFYVPVEGKIGWNWSDSSENNEFGLVKWKGPGADTRTRPPVRTPRGHKLADFLHG